jgi:hypothetical protein
MDSPPTPRQLSYLRSLANRTGQTFAYPKTFQMASGEITRLQNARPSSRTEVRIERKQIADAIVTGPADSSRILDHEIHGYGSNATWVQNRDQEPAVPADPGPGVPRRPAPRVGKRTELARYTIPSGTRVVYGQRVDGVVRVTDCPLQPGERAYLVERELEQVGRSALNALVADYVATAQKLAAIPMAVSPLESYLEITA